MLELSCWDKEFCEIRELYSRDREKGATYHMTGLARSRLLLAIELTIALRFAVVKGRDDRVGHVGNLSTHIARLPPFACVVQDL